MKWMKATYEETRVYLVTLVVGGAAISTAESIEKSCDTCSSRESF